MKAVISHNFIEKEKEGSWFPTSEVAGLKNVTGLVLVVLLCP
jgi:hypothetical protein